ncbi:Alpha/Beta hydrolase protein [Geopyxis carbonaria]|nr:Alpha/Beta hydrolase protein [Geopyxis carbonaria]
MHGLFGSKQNNRSISKALARDCNSTVYALDLRNHGESPHTKRHDYECMAADVEDFIRAHKLDRPILIGHSMGGKAAMAVSLRNGDLISKVVCVDNAPVEATLASSFGSYIQAMRRIEEGEIKTRSGADTILAEYEKNIDVRHFLMTNLIRSDSPYLKWRIPVRILGNALDKMGSFPYHPDKVRFDKPTLFIRGTKSHYVPDEVLPVIGRFFPLFQVKDVDAGHWLIAEKPNEFKEHVLEFLDIDE